MPARKASALVCTRKPTAKPTPAMSAVTKTLRAEVGDVRPASTAERAMGSERKRSSRPLCTSAARPTAVLVAPNTAVCTKMPGMRKSTYGTPPGTWMAPPNT